MCRFQGPNICEVNTNHISPHVGIHFGRVFVVVQYFIVLFQTIMYAHFRSTPLPDLTEPIYAGQQALAVGLECLVSSYFFYQDNPHLSSP